MTNRKKIENFCKQKDIKIIKLMYIRETDHLYGDSWDASYWLLKCRINENIYFFHSSLGDDINSGIELMFADITSHIEKVLGCDM